MINPVPIPSTCEDSRCPVNVLLDVVFLPLILTTDGAAFCTARTMGEYRLGDSWAIADATINSAGITATIFTSCCGRKNKELASPNT